MYTFGTKLGLQSFAAYELLLMADDPAEMAAQAIRCRRLAKWCNGPMKASMIMMAEDYQIRAQVAKSPGSK
jgi:hypothetical protein